MSTPVFTITMSHELSSERRKELLDNLTRSFERARIPALIFNMPPEATLSYLGDIQERPPESAAADVIGSAIAAIVS